MSEQNVQAVRGLYDAFNRGDLDTVERGFSREFVWNEAENSLRSGGNPYRNFASVRDGVFAPTERDFDQFRVDVEQLIDGGDYVVATGRYRGKCRATGQTASSGSWSSAADAAARPATSDSLAGIQPSTTEPAA